MLKRRIEEDGVFKYHPKCAKQRISHLSFADDLFLFSAADPYSIQILKDALDEFGRCSGLWPNNSKINIFFGNVPRDNKLLIHNILEFNVGTLPVRYFGVPLISSRLWINDCKPLIQKVRDKIDAWQNKWLNYAGRLQLATFILMSLQVYWGSIFIQPISVTKQIEKMIRCFIWGGNEAVKGKAKVKWIHAYRIKGCSFWDIRVHWDASWSWKNILEIREEIKPFIRSKLGNGQNINFWFDTWALEFPFSRVCSYRDIRGMGFNRCSKVADVLSSGSWEWPRGLLEKIPQLSGIHPRLSEQPDQVNWMSRLGKIEKFSVHQRKGYCLEYRGNWDQFIQDAAANWKGGVGVVKFEGVLLSGACEYPLFRLCSNMRVSRKLRCSFGRVVWYLGRVLRFSASWGVRGQDLKQVRGQDEVVVGAWEQLAG
ncbi:hypothetical protein AgCh_009316 [Apium graveolens]